MSREKHAPHALLIGEYMGGEIYCEDVAVLSQGALIKICGKGMTTLKEVQIYTDGSCKRNPGPGGYGAVLRCNGQEKILSGGFRLTTNNRMEMLGAIAALESLADACAVTLTSDSKYVVDAVSKGWARKWRKNNWKKSDGQKALNQDLWIRLLGLCERHQVRFVWVRGHDGHPENERCDQMATAAADAEDLPVDEGYELTTRPAELRLF